MPAEALIRQLIPQDQTDLSFLVNHSEYIYRHLDWRSSTDWLGSEPFLGLERNHRLVAALACPQDETMIRWIRLFTFLSWNSGDMAAAWQTLFQQVQNTVPPASPTVFAGLGLSPWFTELLLESGFHYHQDIIVLMWSGVLPIERPLPAEVRVRLMDITDIPQVSQLDQAAFTPLWHQNEAELQQAMNQAAYATVAVMDGQVIGYQISTSTPYHAHLARLAVHPDLQRLSIGYSIVRELLDHFTGHGISHITVNTQSDNIASQKLYEKLGFHLTGDTFPVYTLPVH